MPTAPSSKSPQYRYLKADISRHRIEVEGYLTTKLKEFHDKLIVNFYPASKTAKLTVPIGIYSRDVEEGDEAIRWFAEISLICKDIAKIRQQLKLLYLQEDIAKE